MKLVAHRLEQIAQIELLDCDLDIDFEVIPKANRRVVARERGLRSSRPNLDFVSMSLVSSLFDADGRARIVFGANIERQRTGLATIGDQLLRGVKVAFAQGRGVRGCSTSRASRPGNPLKIGFAG